MSRPQPHSTFIVPEAQQPVAGVHAAPKTVREPVPFVIVPASMVIHDEREKLEPHWDPAIDAATD